MHSPELASSWKRSFEEMNLKREVEDDKNPPPSPSVFPSSLPSSKELCPRRFFFFFRLFLFLFFFVFLLGSVI